MVEQLDERFAGDALDAGVWFPYYLPHWSSRAAAGATHTGRDGLTVREPQPTFWGYTPRYGRIEVRMRGTVTPRSMIAFWLSGIEDRPERSGEICVAEIFGDAVRPGSAEVGMGLHQFRDPALREEFAAEPLP